MDYILFLDDDRHYLWYVKEPYIVVACASMNAFVKAIEELGLPKKIYFDHDLAGDKNGYDCAVWLVQYCLDNELEIPLYHIQSANPVGAQTIRELLIKYGRRPE